MYYRSAEGAIIFFDISNRESFEHVPKWIEEIISNVDDIPILIVGNFMTEESKRKVERKEAENLALGSQAYYTESYVDDLTAINNIFYSLSSMMIGIDVPDQYLSYKRNRSDTNIWKKNTEIKINRF